MRKTTIKLTLFSPDMLLLLTDNQNESRDHLQTAAASHLAMEDKHRFVVRSPKFYVKKLA